MDVPPHVTPGPGVHPLGAGVFTLTWGVPTEAISAAEIVALTPVRFTNIVVRLFPFHSTPEHGTKPLPITVSRNPDDPATALFGMSEVMTGTGSEPGAVIMKDEDAEVVVELETVTAAVPENAVSAAEIIAVSCCVALTNVVGRGDPFQFTTRPSTKFVPFTVKVMPVTLQDGVVFEEVVDAESEVMIGGTIENGTLDVPPPGAGVDTLTWAVPTDTIFPAGIMAISCVALL